MLKITLQIAKDEIRDYENMITGNKKSSFQSR